MGRSESLLKLEIVPIDAFRNTPRHDAEIEWISAERVRGERDEVTSCWPQIPVRFAACVIHRNLIDDCDIQRRAAEVQREPVERFEPLIIGVQRFFFAEVFWGGISGG